MTRPRNRFSVSLRGERSGCNTVNKVTYQSQNNLFYLQFDPFCLLTFGRFKSLWCACCRHPYRWFYSPSYSFIGKRNVSDVVFWFFLIHPCFAGPDIIRFRNNGWPIERLDYEANIKNMSLFVLSLNQQLWLNSCYKCSTAFTSQRLTGSAV